MNVENGVRVVAGSMLLLSLALTHWVHPGFVWFSVFVGINLIQSAFSGICPAATLLKKLNSLYGHRPCASKCCSIFNKVVTNIYSAS